MLSSRAQNYTTTTTVLRPFFLGPPGWDSARRELLDFMVQGKINRSRHTENPAGHHSIRINQCPPPPSSIFFTGRMPFRPPNQPCQSTEGKITIQIKFLSPAKSTTTQPPYLHSLSQQYQRLSPICIFFCGTYWILNIQQCHQIYLLTVIQIQNIVTFSLITSTTSCQGNVLTLVCLFVKTKKLRCIFMKVRNR